MRDGATLAIGVCVVSLLAASGAAAQSSDTASFFSFFETGTTQSVQPSADLARDTGEVSGWSAQQDTAEAAAWEATLTLEPQLAEPPREVRVPRPALATRPEIRPALGMPAMSGGKQHALSGIASFYWQDQMTASGERFDKNDLTAAHRSLPFGTRVRVFCQKTGKDVVVRINDRGPFKPGRIIDLSQAAAEKIGMTGRGLTTVQLEVVRN